MMKQKYESTGVVEEPYAGKLHVRFCEGQQTFPSLRIKFERSVELSTRRIYVMTEKVRYEELLPHEFLDRLAKNPVGYLPLGTLEWHGPHNALGADGIQARGL